MNWSNHVLGRDGEMWNNFFIILNKLRFLAKSRKILMLHIETIILQKQDACLRVEWETIASSRKKCCYKIDNIPT